MRDLMFLGAMLFLIPLVLRNTFAAYLVWGWTALIGIDEYLYGFMTAVRFNFLFALICLGMLLVNTGKHDGQWKLTRTSFLLFLLFGQATLTALFAYPGVPSNWVVYEKIVKVLLFVMVMPLILVGRYRIHAFVFTLCLGMSFHGLIEGLKVLKSGGGHHVQGLAKFGDNNHFAVLIVLAMPLLLYLYRQTTSRIVKFSSLSAFTLCIATVIGTNSRGGLLCLTAMALWLVFSSQKKLLGLTLVGVTAAIVISFSPGSWLERMDTIKSASEDTSFLGRVESWQISTAIALNNPFLGGGFHSLEHAPVFQRFRGSTGFLGFMTPNAEFPYASFRAAHSIYFEAIGDMGLMGFFIIFSVWINTIITALECRRLASGIGASMDWAIDLANAIIAIVIAFLVGGAGVTIAYSENIFVISMLAEMLKQHILNNRTIELSTGASASGFPYNSLTANRS